MLNLPVGVPDLLRADLDIGRVGPALARGTRAHTETYENLQEARPANCKILPGPIFTIVFFRFVLNLCSFVNLTSFLREKVVKNDWINFENMGNHRRFLTYR